jgi:hypothetical protein
MRAVADEMAVHNMWHEGDGEQDVRFYLRKVEDVLRESIVKSTEAWAKRRVRAGETVKRRRMETNSRAAA